MIKLCLAILLKRKKARTANMIAIKSSYNVDELGDSFIPVHLIKP